MLGTIVNAAAIIAASLLGILLRGRISHRYSTILFDGLAICIIVIGIINALKVENMLLVIGSVVVGSLLGQWMGIEDRLDRVSHRLEERFAAQDDTEGQFAKGFITSTLLFCVGSMAIVGSLQSGLAGDHSILFSKSALDGVTSVLLASTMGLGVLFSAIPLFLYQGIITLGSSFAKDLLTPMAIADMSSVGGILIIGIGISMMNLKKIAIGNMLPSVFIPILYYGILGLF